MDSVKGTNILYRPQKKLPPSTTRHDATNRRSGLEAWSTERTDELHQRWILHHGTGAPVAVRLCRISLWDLDRWATTRSTSQLGKNQISLIQRNPR